MRPTLARLGALLALALPLTSCDQTLTTCTLIGCEDGVSVRVASEGDRFADGAYTLRVQTDAEAETCEFTIHSGLVSEKTCPAFFEVGIEGPDRVTMFRRGLAETVRVEVSRDGAGVRDVRVPLAYEPQYPNGVRCGEVCRQATVVVTVP